MFETVAKKIKKKYLVKINAEWTGYMKRYRNTGSYDWSIACVLQNPSSSGMSSMRMVFLGFGTESTCSLSFFNLTIKYPLLV